MAQVARLVQDILELEAQVESADALGDAGVPLQFRPVEALGITPVFLVTQLCLELKLVLGGVGTLGIDPSGEGVHVGFRLVGIPAQAAAAADARPHGIAVLVKPDIHAQVGGIGLRSGFCKAALAAVEAVSGRIAPEIGHKFGIIELVFVQRRKDALCQVIGIIAEGQGAVQAQGPDFLGIQRRGVIGRQGQIHGRLPHVHGDTVQDAGGIVPGGVANLIGADGTKDKEHEVGELGGVTQRPVGKDGGLCVRLEVHVAHAHPGQV